MPRVAELNSYVPVSCITGPLTEDALKSYQVSSNWYLILFFLTIALYSYVGTCTFERFYQFIHIIYIYIQSVAKESWHLFLPILGVLSTQIKTCLCFYYSWKIYLNFDTRHQPYNHIHTILRRLIRCGYKIATSQMELHRN